MNRVIVGVDTSCYTTSVACVSSEGIVFEKRTMLSVALGERGLRQSDAVFQHVRNLPALTGAVFAEIGGADVAAVAVSVKPTDCVDSYMPVFLTGKAVACAMADALHVPLIETAHQPGHVRAALFGNEELLSGDKLIALHLSGGTTDILSVTLEDGAIGTITPLGGSDDLHAGQFVDRVGVKMGLPFPAGRSLEQLASAAEDRGIRLPKHVRGLRCSFSGQETQACRLLDGGTPSDAVAFSVYDCLARTIAKLIENALEAYGAQPVLLSGGVSGSALLRTLLFERTGRKLYYAGEGLSSDNAVGVALMGLDWWKRHA